MKLLIKNKFISLGGSSFVKNENDEKVFKVKGKMISPTHKKKIYDMNGGKKYIVRNKFWKLFKSTSLIYDFDSNKIGALTNKDLDFKNSYVLHGAADDITISGNLLQFPNMKLDITKNGTKIGTVIKQFTIVRDTYTVEVDDDTEAAFLVALVIAIDNILDRRRND
ncbi:MAG: LURP-one-related family protein [Acholeplasmatales bacterium]|nr:LURP-one-related family protein [Acholeplasmatales bacterium]